VAQQRHTAKALQPPAPRTQSRRGFRRHYATMARQIVSDPRDPKEIEHIAGIDSTPFGEEEEMYLTKVVPFLVEDELMRLGATFEKRADWKPLSVVDGRLITGQNPTSSTVAAQNLMNVLV